MKRHQLGINIRFYYVVAVCFDVIVSFLVVARRVSAVVAVNEEQSQPTDGRPSLFLQLHRQVNDSLVVVEVLLDDTLESNSTQSNNTTEHKIIIMIILCQVKLSK